MDLAAVATWTSLITGLASAACWCKAAVVRVAPPPEFEGKPDDMYYGHIIANGSDLIPTIKAQASWNSWAAFAAATTVVLQLAAAFLPKIC